MFVVVLVRRGLLLFPHPISHSKLDHHQIRNQVNVAVCRQALKSLCWRFSLKKVPSGSKLMLLGFLKC